MRSPSSRVLANVADIYPATVGQDSEGGATWSYPAVPTQRQQPCSAQPVAVRETLENERITLERDWEITFGETTSVSPRDKLVVTDRLGVQHVIFAHAEQDQAGRGAAFVVFGVEKL